MPFDLTVHAGYFRLHAHGVLTAPELADSARQAVEIEHAHPEGIDRLVDLRDVTEFKVQYTDVSDFASLRRRERLPRRVRSAILAVRPVAIGFANMYDTILNHPDIEVRVFQDEAEALAWLRAAPPAP